MNHIISTESIYNDQAENWLRSEKILLSDYTARPIVLQELGSVTGQHLLDVGCGEGYVSRIILDAGAASVFGVDSSSEMISQAKSVAAELGLHKAIYEVSDAVTFNRYPRTQFDQVIAIFLFNYLTVKEMTQVMTNVKSLLSPNGIFIFTVPHPCLPFMRNQSPPFYFKFGDKNYFEGVDVTFEGRIWRRDGITVPVRCVHKTFTHYFEALQSAGFKKMPSIRELAVTEEHLTLDPEFFGPLKGYPLHLLFKVQANG
ncbi:class I SAM-dependent methyltransferase [Microbulbifer sp. MLAF003]|uniref:class I SAM-dependent methyltransferase n=1 Tax=Microbulbifer TaxID=48073 RepID=UPI000375F31A|nr:MULTISPECIES: class I SAM-dependent methyltransferase [Microbulbifer]WHI49717.1 class I SAM-dependent methyltransferase [Microbulbifer sp. MLAF003]